MSVMCDLTPAYAQSAVAIEELQCCASWIIESSPLEAQIATHTQPRMTFRVNADPLQNLTNST